MHFEKSLRPPLSYTVYFELLLYRVLRKQPLPAPLLCILDRRLLQKPLELVHRVLDLRKAARGHFNGRQDRV